MGKTKNSEITALTAADLSKALKAGEVSAREAAAAYFDAIEKTDGDIGAYLTLTPKAALADADKVDAARRAGEKLPPLAGVPAGVKDNICTAGVRTTCASKMLENFVPPYDAFVIKRLREAGTVMLGKLNMDEFAMGSTTESSYFKKTRNPRDPSRVPGGSSGGAAAAVAALEAAFALGSDTGGSIRQPAAFCGVVGLKPTYGSVSRNGLVAFASSLDQIGPITRDVRDAALVLNVIAAHDKGDSTSLDREYPDFTARLGEDIKGLRIALPTEFFGEGLCQNVKASVMDAARRFERLGARISEVSMPSLAYALPAYCVISSAEASSNLARFDGVKYGYRSDDYEDIDSLYRRTRSEGFGREVKRRILLGTFALSSGYYDAYYKKALQVRTLVVRDYERVLSQHDIILSPVTPTVAYRLGEKIGDPLQMYLGDIYTVPVNIAGLPALSLPCGADPDGLPIGMQLIGRAFAEADILRAGYAFEQDAGVRFSAAQSGRRAAASPAGIE